MTFRRVSSKRHKSPGTDQIPAEFIKAVGRTIRSAIRKLSNLIWNKEELSEEWKDLFIRRAITETAVNKEAYHY